MHDPLSKWVMPMQASKAAVRAIYRRSAYEEAYWGALLTHWQDNLRSVFEGQGPERSDGEKCLRDGQDILNREFFLGVVGEGEVKVKWIPGLYKEDDKTLGCCTGYEYGDGGTLVELDPYPLAQGATLDYEGQPLADYILQTLIHELCHALLRRISCCNRLCGDDSCVANKDIEQGEDGYGLAWYLLLEAIEHVSDDYFGVKLFCGKGGWRDEWNNLADSHGV